MVAGVGIKEKEWKCCPWWRALVAAKAYEGCAEMGGGEACGRSHWGAFGGAPHGATKRVREVLDWVVQRHVGATIGAFGGAPYGATKRVGGVPKLMVRCGRGHWGLRWTSPKWATKLVSGVPVVVGAHADAAFGAFGGAPYGATQLLRGVLT